MIRNEFLIKDLDEMLDLIETSATGVASFNSEDGFPYSIPMNFIWLENKIYLHGALIGKKIDCMKYSSKIQFLIYKKYSYIPSYFTDINSPCNATQFFKSVIIKGISSVIDDNTKKAVVLDAMMKKYQPEGKCDSLVESEKYIKMIKATALIEIVPVDITGKYKFGQNLNDETRKQIIAGLENKSGSEVEQTINEITRRAIKK